MVIHGDSSEMTWNVTILNKTKDGYLVMAPNGDTVWITYQDYEIYLNNLKNVW